MQFPRLGDDGLFYLSKGQTLFSTVEGQQLPAQRDIAAQLSDFRIKNDSEAKNAARISAQVFGHHTPLFDLLAALITFFVKPPHLAFAVLETIVLICILAGVKSFLEVIVTPLSAQLSMAVLATALLPGQGLDYHIPSTMCLGLSLWLAANLARGERSALTLSICSLSIVSLHQIGIAHLVLAIFSALIFFHVRKMLAASRVAVRIFLCTFPGFLYKFADWLWLDRLFFPFGHVYSSKIGLVETFKFNAEGIANTIHHLSPLLLLFALLGIGTAFANVKRAKQQILLVTFLSAVLFVSCFHYLRWYPAELFNRYCVLFLIITIAIGIDGLVRTSQTRVKVKAFIVSSIFALSIFGSSGFVRYFFKNLNDRIAVLNAEDFSSEIQTLSSTGTRIIYLETELSLRASMLFGGFGTHGLAAPLVQSAREFSGVGILPQLRILNWRSFTNSHSLKPRRHAILVDEVDQVRIKTAKTSKLYLRVRSSKAHSFSYSVNGVEKERPLYSDLTETIEVSTETTQDVDLKIPGGQPVAVEGLLDHDFGSGKVSWPWNKGFSVEIRSSDMTYKSSFALNELFDESRVTMFRDRLNPKVLSDTSGFVFLDYR